MTMVDESELINSVAVKGYHHGVLTKAQWPALRATLINKYKEVAIARAKGGPYMRD